MMVACAVRKGQATCRRALLPNSRARPEAPASPHYRFQSKTVVARRGAPEHGSVATQGWGHPSPW